MNKERGQVPFLTSIVRNATDDLSDRGMIRGPVPFPTSNVRNVAGGFNGLLGRSRWNARE